MVLKQCQSPEWHLIIPDPKEFASDIAETYPEKQVTLVHSGPQLLPRFDLCLHEECEYSCYCSLSRLASYGIWCRCLVGMRVLSDLGVNVMLSSRVDLSTKTKRTLRTCDGRFISAELIVRPSPFVSAKSPDINRLALLDIFSFFAQGKNRTRLLLHPSPPIASTHVLE